MSHYKSNLRDLQFNLFEANDIRPLLGRGPYAGMDADTARMILDEVDRLAREEFAGSFEEADRVPLTLTDGSVELPEGLKGSLEAYRQGGWAYLAMPRELGGMGATPSLAWATEIGRAHV